ncbi:MAG: xanthine dehydrogenase family protein subunit M [Pseudomonadota bacterium]
MYAFDFVRPASLAEAVAFLEANPEAKPLSGGMTLVPTLKQRMAAPSHLVDLTRLPELHGIACTGNVLRIGAATTHAQVASSPVVAAAIPALAHLAGLIADPQVRNRGTIGGSIANNDPAADFPAALLALDATVITNARRIAADDFIVGMFETALMEGELVIGLEFPCPDAGAYHKHAHAASGYAVTGVFAARHGAQVRIGVTGAGPNAFRWTEAEQALRRDLSVAALDGVALDADALLDDAGAPAAYRANLVRVYTRRSVAAMLAADGRL